MAQCPSLTPPVHCSHAWYQLTSPPAPDMSSALLLHMWIQKQFRISKSMLQYCGSIGLFINRISYANVNYCWVIVIASEMTMIQFLAHFWSKYEGFLFIEIFLILRGDKGEYLSGVVTWRGIRGSAEERRKLHETWEPVSGRTQVSGDPTLYNWDLWCLILRFSPNVLTLIQLCNFQVHWKLSLGVLGTRIKR